ncbi:MAG: sigma 54-interacting transcriptional regulator [bacterium]
MNNIKKIFSNRRTARAAVLLGIFTVALIFGSTLTYTNQIFENIFYSIKGEAPPDTNIIIIHIDQNDVDRLGWPLKRNYYALLINKLKSLNVKTIGLEVFISENVSFQAVYNELLNEEIKSAGNVVLSSLAEGVRAKDDVFVCDSVIYPQPQKEITDVPTGHLNYLTDDGVFVPGAIKAKTTTEKSFSSKLAESFKGTVVNDLMKVNINSSWKRFRNYSLIEFFDNYEQSENTLKLFEGKLVIIGVSDPSIAKSISTGFDTELPGVALHAFAVDNILNSRSLVYDFINESSLLFLILFLTLVFIFKNKIAVIIYAGIFIIGIILFYILHSSFYIELNYSVFFLLLLSLIVYDTWQYILESKEVFSQTLSESEILKRTLIAKEESLQSLQREMETSAKRADASYLKKIDELKIEVDQLKKFQEEEEPAPVQKSDTIKNFESIIYCGSSMNKVIDVIKKVAPTTATVLITGESGSGKELVARAIHNLSERKNGNFVAVNCAALTETLLESELFGHVKGAFTNAVSDREGRFEYANKGTIFLDEIGETSENFQAKLLRVIQSGEFEKVGSPKTMRSDARIVAATNRNLEQQLKEKKFREDLYYRLNVIRIEIPALRERKDDIPALAQFFVTKENPEIKISKGVIEQLTEYEWKGNVRELESIIKRALIYVKSENRDIIKLNDLPTEIAKAERSNLEKMILDSLREKEFSHSSINETAKELGDLSRTIISENFRGIFFKNFVEQNFDFNSAIEIISAVDDKEITERVKSKCDKYLSNIQNDLKKSQTTDFDSVKNSFSSKYKNLPKKYHSFLDETIKFLIKVSLDYGISGNSLLYRNSTDKFS